MADFTPISFDGYKVPPDFSWKWTFCEEWQILGGLAHSQAELGKWTSLLFLDHGDKDPRQVAREEWKQAQAASSGQNTTRIQNSRSWRFRRAPQVARSIQVLRRR